MNSMDKDIDHILVTEEQMKAKVAELGAQISRDYAGKDLLLVSILKGAVVFMADLMREVKIPCAIDFMVVSSYGGANTSSTGLVKIIKDLDADLTGRDVLIVEDILDTGITLSKLVPVLKMRNPAAKPTLSRTTAVLRCLTSSWSATAWTTTKSTATCPTWAYSSRKCIPTEPKNPKCPVNTPDRS